MTHSLRLRGHVTGPLSLGVTCKLLIFLFTFSVEGLCQEIPDTSEKTGGLNFADPLVYASLQPAATPLGGQLPEQVDLQPSFPIPGYQGTQLSCVGWAVAYAAKSFGEAQRRGWPGNTSWAPHNHPFSPSFVYNQIKSNMGCTGGTYYIDALNLLVEQGVPPLSAFPYFGVLL